jgi:hypothetical protein
MGVFRAVDLALNDPWGGQVFRMFRFGPIPARLTRAANSSLKPDLSQFENEFFHRAPAASVAESSPCRGKQQRFARA